MENTQISEKSSNMRYNLVVSKRGQTTLPASIRKRLGIQSGGMVTLEEKESEVVLNPASVVCQIGNQHRNGIFPDLKTTFLKEYQILVVGHYHFPCVVFIFVEH